MGAAKRVVVVGNGVAGVEAVNHLVDRGGGQVQVTLISEESEQFFSRTALLYVLAGQLSYRCIQPNGPDWASRRGVRALRARVLSVDPDRRTLVTDGAGEQPWDGLLLATGSRPRRGPWPGSDLPGVGHFVTLQDLAWLEAELWGKHQPGAPEPRPTTTDSPYQRPPSARVRRGGRPPREVVVIGGGLIGIELVEVLLARGWKPTFLLRQSWFWPMALDAREAAWVEARLRQHGAQVVKEAEVEALLPGADGAVGSVVTNRGTFAADLVLVAIGVTPNTTWLQPGPRRASDGGWWVDARLQTAWTDVYAAGDCAAVPQAQGEPRVEPLWYTARDQGRAAARSLLGQAGPYQRGVPYNAAKLMDIEYTTVGQVGTGQVGDLPCWRFTEDGRVQSQLRLTLDGEAVVGMNALGRRWDTSRWRTWVAERRPLPWVLARLGEARFDTEGVPPLDLRHGTIEVPS